MHGYKNKNLICMGYFTKMTDFERQILSKLVRRRVWGSKHIRLDTLLRCGWKPHERGLVKAAVKSLLKKGHIVWAKREKKAIQLNQHQSKEIFNTIMGEN